MVPGAQIITEPFSDLVSGSRECRTGDDEGAQAWSTSEQGLMSCGRHHCAVQVVCLEMSDNSKEHVSRLGAHACHTQRAHWREQNSSGGFSTQRSYPGTHRPTFRVWLERTPAVLLMAYGGSSKSSPAWLGTPRFACSLFPLSKIGAEGFGGDEVREGGTSLAIACATGLSQG